MLPRMLFSFGWVDRSAGLLKYTFRKAWVPHPGDPTSTRVILEGRVVVPTHVSEERELLALLLRSLADELAGPLEGD